VVQGVQQVTSRSRPAARTSRSSSGGGPTWTSPPWISGSGWTSSTSPGGGSPHHREVRPASEPVIRFALVSDRPLDPRVAGDRQELIALRWLAEEQVRRTLEGSRGWRPSASPAVWRRRSWWRWTRVAWPSWAFRSSRWPAASPPRTSTSRGDPRGGRRPVRRRTVNEFTDVNEMLRVVVGTAGRRAHSPPGRGDGPARSAGAGDRLAGERERGGGGRGPPGVHRQHRRPSPGWCGNGSPSWMGTSRAGSPRPWSTDQAVFIERAVDDVREGRHLRGASSRCSSSSSSSATSPPPSSW
jgi:hypothetical protein